MNEAKDISRQRLADFLAARLRARDQEKPEPREPVEPRSISPTIVDDRAHGGGEVRISRR